MKVLKKLKVLELANVLAGPAVGMFLAELGAQVTKVENKSLGGDMTRQWKNPNENASLPHSAYFCSVNWGKKHLFLDFTHDKDYAHLTKLIAKADVLICNFKKGDDKKFKLDYKSIKKIHPQLIYASINGYGKKSNRTAYDVVLQAESGFMYMNGTAESGPVKMPVAFIDLFAAHQLKEGILLALYNKQKTKKGAKVEVSLFDAAIASLANQASNWLMSSYLPKAMGTLHPNIAPYGEMFNCVDKKQIVLAIGTQKQFATLCQALQLNELITNPSFVNNKSRVQHRQELYEILRPVFEQKTAQEWSLLFNTMNVPAGIVKNLQEVFEDENASRLILSDKIGKRVKTAVFTLS